MNAKNQAASAAKAETASPLQVGKRQKAIIRGSDRVEEWNAIRDAAFAELRKYEIPEDLVDAVHGFRPHAAVTLAQRQG